MKSNLDTLQASRQKRDEPALDRNQRLIPRLLKTLGLRMAVDPTGADEARKLGPP